MMKFEKKVICVCCDSSFFVVITDDHKVYTWGINNDGQLGNSTCTDKFTEELHEVKFYGHKIGNFSFFECISKDLWILSKRKWIEINRNEFVLFVSNPNSDLLNPFLSNWSFQLFGDKNRGILILFN